MKKNTWRRMVAVKFKFKRNTLCTLYREIVAKSREVSSGVPVVKALGKKSRKYEF